MDVEESIKMFKKRGTLKAILLITVIVILILALICASIYIPKTSAVKSKVKEQAQAFSVNFYKESREAVDQKEACEAVASLNYSLCNDIETESIGTICRQFYVQKLFALKDCANFDNKKTELGLDTLYDGELCSKVKSKDCSGLTGSKKDGCEVIIFLDIEKCKTLGSYVGDEPEKDCSYGLNLYQAFQPGKTAEEGIEFCKLALSHPSYAGIFRNFGLRICQNILNNDCNNIIIPTLKLTQKDWDYAWANYSINTPDLTGCKKIKNGDMKASCLSKK